MHVLANVMLNVAVLMSKRSSLQNIFLHEIARRIPSVETRRNLHAHKLKSSAWQLSKSTRGGSFPINVRYGTYNLELQENRKNNKYYSN